MSAKVWLVGAGPGDPELLTLKAVKALQQADIVMIDDLVNPAVLEHCPAARVVPVGKRGGCRSTPQAFIHRLMLRYARQGKCVVRLKGGDPFIFGRGAEELEFLLAHGIDCQVVPGITAAAGCTAYAGIPLTHRDLAHSCQFITGHLQQDGELQLPWSSLADPGKTLVFYMGLASLGVISRQLIAAGLPPHTPAALIGQGARVDQQLVRGRLSELPQLARDTALATPVLTVIGKVVGLFAEQQIEFPARLRAPRTVLKEASCG